MDLRSLSLCAGIGGIDLGLRGVARTVCYVEREAFAAATLVRQMEAGRLDPAPVWSDLSTFDARAWRGAVDLVMGGIPCQPHSLAGKRRGLTDERDMLGQFVRVVDEATPAFALVENVPGFRKHGLPALLTVLAELGFDAEWDLFSAAEAGAPHLRRRMFVLAAHPDFVGRRCGGCSMEQDPKDANNRGSGPNRKTGSSDVRWSTESDVGRVAYGTPNRMERLRSIGNGVVPAVVRMAWDELMARFT
jgi:DNA (cytosine-5)-methyltransferase 1